MGAATYSAEIDRCGECGFDWDGTAPTGLVVELTAVPHRYRAQLGALVTQPEVAPLRTRPDPTTWSALEYVAHTRDALAFYAERIERVLGEERPTLGPFDADAACEDRRYNHEDVEEALDGLAGVARRLGARLAGLLASSWSRIGIGTDGGERSVLQLVRRAVHEGQHHLLDIERALRGLRRVSGRRPSVAVAVGRDHPGSPGRRRA